MKVYQIDVRLVDIEEGSRYMKQAEMGVPIYMSHPNDEGKIFDSSLRTREYKIRKLFVRKYNIINIAVQHDQEDVARDLISPKLEEIDNAYREGHFVGMQYGEEREKERIAKLPWWCRLMNDLG